MKRHAIRLIGLGIALILALGVQGKAQADGSIANGLQKAAEVLDAFAEYARFVQMLATIEEPLVQAMFSVYNGLTAADPADQRRAAQAVVNLLEGADSPLYDPAVELNATLRVGVRTIVEDYRVQSGASEDVADGERTWNPENPPTAEFLFTILPDLQDDLRLASVAAQLAAHSSTSSRARRDSLLTAQALLAITNMLRVELTKPLRVTVSPGESLQSAIDRAWPASTITIEPGVYRETLDIRKSITLVGAGFDVVVEPINGQDGILVRADEEIAVEIRGLTIQQAGTGLSVEGDASVKLDSVHVDSCDTGLRISGGAIVTGEEVRWSNCELAILAEGESSLDLNDSRIDDCTSTAAAVVVEDVATVAMQQTWVNRSLGGAFLLTGSGSLSLNDCGIYYSAGDGILLTGTASLEIRDCDINLNLGFGIRALTNQCDEDADRLHEPFVGTITGAGNLILAEGQYPGNKLGAVCPEDLEYLLKNAGE